MGLSHYSPLIHAVLVLQRLLADTKPSTVQTPASTESCEKQIRHSEATLVLREHLGGPSLCSCRAHQGEAGCNLYKGTGFATGKVGRIKRHSWNGRLRNTEADRDLSLSTPQIKRLSQERLKLSENHIITIITFPFYNNQMAQCQLALGSHCCFSFLA